eukprot:5778270-Prorocentrum_lima.AAC.1
MTSSLVGSEMCIRDRFKALHGHARVALHATTDIVPHIRSSHTNASSSKTVSYTHLTLPTICSV